MIFLLLHAAAACMGAAMRRWAIAAEADGCLSPAPTWAITCAGIYTCTAALLGAMVAAGFGEADIGDRLTVQLAAALTAAHLAWGAGVIALGVREVYGPAPGTAERVGTLNRGASGLAEVLRAPRDSCLEACRRHVHTTLTAVLCGAGTGLLGGTAENAAAGAGDTAVDGRGRRMRRRGGSEPAAGRRARRRRRAQRRAAAEAAAADGTPRPRPARRAGAAKRRATPGLDHALQRVGRRVDPTAQEAPGCDSRSVGDVQGIGDRRRVQRHAGHRNAPSRSRLR